MATPWNIDTAVYEEKYKYVGSEDSAPIGVSFKPDGTKMYITGYTNSAIYQYSLSMPWDISSAVYEDKSMYTGDEDIRPANVAFNPDGTKMYIMGSYADKVHQYALSTPWDISTSTYEGKFIYVGGQDATPVGVAFSPDGTRMYIMGYSRSRVHQYSLSTAWDVSTATWTGNYKDVSSQELGCRGLAFKPDGTRMYIEGSVQDAVFQYTLSIAWDILTAIYDEKNKYIGDEDDLPFGLFFKPDGSKIYIMGYSTKTVYQYSLPPPKTYYKSLGGSLSFLGSLSTAIPGKFLQATLSIVANESILSIAENKSVLSIYENESILSVEE